MPITQSITLYGTTVSTIYLFLFAGFLIFSFNFWNSGKKEGFDEEKLFDLIFLSLLLLGFSLKIDLRLAIILILSLVFALTVYWKWSSFRILDIFSLSAYLGAIVPLTGYVLLKAKLEYLIVLPILILGYIGFSRLRNKLLKSGYSYSLLLLIAAASGAIFFRSKKDLIFYTFLFIISLLNIYLRERKSMPNSNLPANLLNKLKNRLLFKRKMLKTEQKVLLQEDPAKQFDRISDNAELMDEAVLEDTQQEWNDLRRNSVEKMQIQVRKALARMRIGKYGMCEVCGKPIDKARLEAYPEATTCLEHADRS